MGQKVNPNTYRLGINKNWKTEFFEKKYKELPVYIHKDLSIKSFIEKFLETQNLLLHNYKLNYSDFNLNIFISYYVTSSFSTDKKLNLKVKKNKRSQKKKKNLKHDFSNKIKNYLIKNYKFLVFNSSFKTLESIISQKNFMSNPNTYSLNKMTKILNLFLGNKFNITTTFKCINKIENLNIKKIQIIKKKLLLLSRFKNLSSFKETINIIFVITNYKNSSSLLSRFLALQLKKIKRQKFFLNFLKKTLYLFISSNFSRIKGIKLIIKGRLNGVPKAKHKILKIGDISIQTIDSNVDYSESTFHTVNGSYGIKVWIVEKN